MRANRGHAVSDYRTRQAIAKKERIIRNAKRTFFYCILSTD